MFLIANLRLYYPVIYQHLPGAAHYALRDDELTRCYGTISGMGVQCEHVTQTFNHLFQDWSPSQN